MPIIPRPQAPGPLANVPAPVLDRERRPNVDLSGVISATGKLGQASQMPLDNTDYGQQWEALGAVGKAVMQAGGVMQALAVKEQQAKDDTALNELTLEHEARAGEYAAWRAENPNAVDQFSAEAEKLTKGMQEAWAKRQGLSPQAREKIDLMNRSFTQRMGINARTGAAQVRFGQAADSYGLRWQRAYADGNVAEGDRLVDEARGAGYVGETPALRAKWEGADEALKGQVSALDAQADSMIASGNAEGARQLWREFTPPAAVAKRGEEIRTRALTAIEHKALVQEDHTQVEEWEATDPRGGLAKLDTLKHYPEAMKHQARKVLESAAEREAREQVIQAQRALDLLPSLALSKARPENLGVKLDQLSDWHRAGLAQMIKDRQNKDPAVYEDRARTLLAQAAAWVPLDDPEEESIRMGRFEMATNSLPPELQSKVLDRLKATEQEPSELVAVKAYTLEAAKKAAEVPVTGPGGEQLYRDAKAIGKTATVDGWIWDSGGTEIKENGDKPVPLTQVDPVKAKGSAAAAQRVNEALQREFLRNKEAWTNNPELMRKRHGQLMEAEGLPLLPVQEVAYPSLFPPGMEQPGALPTAAGILKAKAK